LICIFLFTATLTVSGTLNIKIKNEKDSEKLNLITKTSNLLDDGWIEEQGGVTILHMNGTHYEMGYQHGYFLKDIIEKNYELLDSLDSELYDFLLEYWNAIEGPTAPQEYLDELQGVADGCGRTFEEVAIFTSANTYIGQKTGCMEMVAWGPATKDRKLYHFYSFDFPKILIDTEENYFFHDSLVLSIRNPNNGYASLGALFPGEVGSYGGINEQGISIGTESSPCDDITMYYCLPKFQILKVLDYSSTAFEAIDMMIDKNYGGFIHHISDGKIPAGYVCEITANHQYIGFPSEINFIEDQKPFWNIDHVLRRKNMFIHPETAATQRKYFNPKLYLFPFIDRNEIRWYNPWRFYKTLSLEIEKIWGNIDLDNTMNMTRSIYLGETDLYLRILNILGIEKFQSNFQWTVCPETGDMAVSFANGNNFAQYGEIHHFNLFDLLNSEPPP